MPEKLYKLIGGCMELRIRTLLKKITQEKVRNFKRGHEKNMHLQNAT